MMKRRDWTRLQTTKPAGWFKTACVGMALCASLFAQTALAQTVVAQTELKPGETIQSDDLAHSYTAFSPLATGPISFQQIYDNPEDQDLNLAYARQQANAGDLLGAAASLERMLYHNPNWDTARLFYAVILYDLDDRKAAAREFSLLEGRPLPPPLARMAQRYNRALTVGAQSRSLLPKGLKPIGKGPYGRMSVSARFDDNAGDIFGDQVFGNQDVSDVSVGGAISIGYRTPVDGSPDVSAFIGADAQTRRYEDVSEADFDVVTVKAGLGGDTDKSRWRAVLEARRIDISGDKYLQQVGASARYGVKVSDTVTVSALGSWVDRNFDDLTASSNASQRSGDLAEIGVGVDIRPDDRWRLAATLSYQTASAETHALAYDGLRLSARAQYQISPDVQASLDVVARDLTYDAPAPELGFSDVRREDYLRVQAAVSVKASTLFNTSDSDTLDRTKVDVIAEHSLRDTNIPQRSFNGNGLTLRLTHDFW